MPRHPQHRPGRAPRRARRGPAAFRVVVADGQAIDRGGMVGLLEGEPDFEVVGEAASTAECIQQCRSLEPDVLVLALNLAGHDPCSALPAVRTALPRLRVLAVSERGVANCLVLNPPGRARREAEHRVACAYGTDCLQLAASQGAMGTLRRSADPEDLFRAVRAVAAGQAWYDTTTADGLLTSTSPDALQGRLTTLSARERDVAAQIADGLSNKEISTALGISEPTVKKHVGRVLEKLGFQDRLQVGLFLARNPLVLRPKS
ncbi:MAG: response regulator transcription factor [Candidatus Eisenbacteria bacterium]|uniref:Response regulator transcription factor n=1 Tax=Eiseniibacteriota bacterium TaxID=2212470 RepID=A0A9D6L9Y5_UNCEI|nr:response regulator transcription factor [Candidatus Eisenbacteria bacterium]